MGMTPFQNPKLTKALHSGRTEMEARREKAINLLVSGATAFAEYEKAIDAGNDVAALAHYHNASVMLRSGLTQFNGEALSLSIAKGKSE